MNNLDHIIPYKGREVRPGVPVWVYRRTSSQGVWYSIQQHGQVVGHTQRLLMRDCKMIVRKGGWRYSVKMQRKGVHAFIRGYICRNPPDFPVDGDTIGRRITYDYNVGPYFYEVLTNDRVEKADYVLLSSKGVSYVS